MNMPLELIRIIAGLVASILFMVLWPRYTRLNPFFSLLFASFLFSLIAGIEAGEILPTMQAGFGSLLQQIGIIVALGSILGKVLEKTGAMQTISTSIIKLFGENRPVMALVVIGALVGIPVFADSGFIILSRMIPAMAAKASVSQGSMVLALSSGLYTTHTLVPPTPGPLAAAATLGMGNSLGAVILVGLAGSIPVVIVSYLYAWSQGKKMSVPSPESALQSPGAGAHGFRAFLPLVLPILLIAGASFTKLTGSDSAALFLLGIMGTPAIALLIGVLLSFTLISPRRQADWPDWITDAIKDAGVIILITGAGGSFGAIIKASGIAGYIADYASGSNLQGVLFLIFGWLIAAILKTSQGSSTSSLIITSALLAPLAAAAGIATVTASSILVLAIGGGAMVVSHANDSYFWVVSQFGGIPEKESFRWYTPLTLLQGLTTLVVAVVMFMML